MSRAVTRIGIVLVFSVLVPCFPFRMESVGSAFPGFGSKEKKDKDTQKKPRDPIPENVLTDLEAGNTIFVGDHAFMAYTHPVHVIGFGLVTGLPGTGNDERPGLPRSMVLRDLQKRDVRKPREVIASTSTAVVVVRGIMREGIGIGESFDVKIECPPDSDVIGLRGGWLTKTALTYAETGEDGAFKTGKTVAYAEGPVLINPTANERDDPAEMTRGKVLGGGVATDSRYLCLVLKPESESEMIAARIAQEINHRFFIPGSKKGIASAKTEQLIELQIHPTYKNNIPRFTRIVQAIALYDNPQKLLERLEVLKGKLHVPQTSADASFQLEAIGLKAIPVLKTGLESKDEEVRFYSAVALAYLNETSAADILGEIVRDVPEFRVFALDALSTMRNDFGAERVLRALLHENSAETRYGAFRSLWLRNERDPVIRGENLGGHFNYHGIVTHGPALVHTTDNRRPEIVLFSTDIRLQGKFILDAGPYILVNNHRSADPDTVVITRLVSDGVNEERRVTTRLDDIIRGVVTLGGTYPDVIQLLHQAQDRGHLPCKLETDKLPESGRVYRRLPDKEEEKTEAKPKLTFREAVNPMTWFEKNNDKKNPSYYNAADNDPRQ